MKKRVVKHNPIHLLTDYRTACGIAVGNAPVVVAVSGGWYKTTCLNCLRTRKYKTASNTRSNNEELGEWQQRPLFGENEVR